MNLNQITVPSLDLNASIEFYSKLGLHLIVEALPRYARFECPVGRSSFSVHLVEKLPEGEGIWIYFELEDLYKKVAELLEKGIQMEEMPLDRSWMWREARLKDPDGNQIILFHAGINRLNPPWRVSGKQNT